MQAGLSCRGALFPATLMVRCPGEQEPQKQCFDPRGCCKSKKETRMHNNGNIPQRRNSGSSGLDESFAALPVGHVGSGLWRDTCRKGSKAWGPELWL